VNTQRKSQKGRRVHDESQEQDLIFGNVMVSKDSDSHYEAE
jgi:hypothetical protein